MKKVKSSRLRKTRELRFSSWMSATFVAPWSVFRPLSFTPRYVIIARKRNEKSTVRLAVAAFLRQKLRVPLLKCPDKTALEIKLNCLPQQLMGRWALTLYSRRRKDNTCSRTFKSDIGALLSGSMITTCVHRGWSAREGTRQLR